MICLNKSNFQIFGLIHIKSQHFLIYSHSIQVFRAMVTRIDLIFYLLAYIDESLAF
jgi:hypothetical protein